MDKKTKNPARIPAREASGLSAWQLPVVGGKHVVRSPFKEKDEVAKPKVKEEEYDGKPLTVEAVEKLRQQARDEAFKKGYKEGLAKGEADGREKGEKLGFQSGQADVDRLKANLAALIQAVDQPVQRQQQELEAALLRLVLDVSQAVVKQSLSQDPQQLKAVVEEAMKALPGSDEPLQIAAHPADQDLLESIKNQEQANWNIVPDTSMTPGGVVVRGANNYLDYSVEGRFTQVAEQLLQEQLSREQAAQADPSNDPQR